MENRNFEFVRNKTLEEISADNIDYIDIDKAEILSLIGALYGEPVQKNGFEYYFGDKTDANSYSFSDMPVRSQNILKMNPAPEPIDSIITSNVRNRVVIELGPGPNWVRNAIYAKALGAVAYICIDIDEPAMTSPEWNAIDSFNQRSQIYGKDNKIEKYDLIGFAFPVIDNPMNLLRNLDNHSAVIISSALFSEPLEKDSRYKAELTQVVRDKTFFGAHVDGPTFDENDFAVSERKSIADRLQVAIFKGRQ
jgi:hypothetical protein